MKPSDQAKIRRLDVRPLIARGEEPFPQIMAAVNALAPDEAFEITAPFLPAPLVERMRSLGYSARPERRADGSWRTFFWKE